METVTIRQAFDAMTCFLEKYYQLTNADEVGGLLSIMQIWGDTTADPAVWEDWMACVQKIQFPDTPEHRQMLQELVTKHTNYLGTDMWHNDWYGEILPDGRQLWAKVRNNTIKYGGLRKIPKSFDPKMGLSNPNDP
jgi:hypothetical protein